MRKMPILFLFQVLDISLCDVTKGETALFSFPFKHVEGQTEHRF